MKSARRIFLACLFLAVCELGELTSFYEETSTSSSHQNTESSWVELESETCNCSATQLVVDELIAGDTWFVLKFSTTGPLEPGCSLTSVRMNLVGPLDKPIPSQNRSASFKIDCFDTHPGGSWIFNSSDNSRCQNPFSAIYSCSRYNLALSPVAAYCRPEESTETSVILATQPGAADRPSSTKVETGSDWLTVQWLDSIWCSDSYTSYWITIESLVDEQLPLGPGEDPITQVVRIPVESECVLSTPADTIFDTRICPGLFFINSCTVYSVGIQTESFGVYNSSSIERVKNTTSSPDDMFTSIDAMDAGFNWISFQWHLSNRHCQSAMTGMRLALIDATDVNLTVLDLTMWDCVYLMPDGESFVFNTSLPGCRSRLPIRSCSDYGLKLVPQIFYEYQEPAAGRIHSRTTPGDNTTALIRSTASGADWISFLWTSSVSECRKAVTGFWLSVLDADEPPAPPSHFFSMIDCYPDLDVDEDIPFNSSMTCIGRSFVDVLPCSSYEVYLQPVFFDSSDGAIASTGISTLPGEVGTLIYSIDSGENWISFLGDVSVNTCRDDVTGFWVKVSATSQSSQGDLELSNNFFCPVGVGGRIEVNTTSPCIDLVLTSCRSYDLEVAAQVDENVTARAAGFSRMTTPASDATALINSELYGENWISFNWTSSAQGYCQLAVTGYRLNLTDNASGMSQIRRYPRNCSIDSENYPFVGFNSSLPCANVTVEPCSSYSIAVAPEFTINSDLFVGTENYTFIGTKSGGRGEVEQLDVVDQGTHSLELRWMEPRCKASALLHHYDVTVNSSVLEILPDCLQQMEENTVSLVLSDSTCNQKGFSLDSCSIYDITVLPVYSLSTANEDLFGKQKTSHTLAEDYEASVNNLTILDSGGQWISLSWPRPACRMPIASWSLALREDLKSKIEVNLPAECPISNHSENTLSLNVSDQTVYCQNSAPVDTAFPIVPCSKYTVKLDVLYEDLDQQDGVNNIAQTSTQSEPPGKVSNLSWIGSQDSISLSWDHPEQNPQCVSKYRVTWKDDEIITSETMVDLVNLIPCTDYVVTVYSLPLTGNQQIGDYVNASTGVVDPAPVSSEINITYVDNNSRNLSWFVPDPDYCVSGYNVLIYETARESTDYLILNETNEGKNSTWLLIGEGFEKKKSYTLFVYSYSSFSESLGNASFKVFIWDTTADVINIVVVAYGITFVLLLLSSVLVVFSVCKRLRSPERKKQSMPEITIETRNRRLTARLPRINIGRKPIAIQYLSRKIELLATDFGKELSQEFEEVKALSSHWDALCTVALLPVNRDKNRYSDILPYDHSRVKLGYNPERPVESDYINASFVSGCDGRRAYIATQGPKLSTLNEFWQMTYEQNIRVILNLTLLEERGKVKCEQYWPSFGSMQYGDIQVQLLNETNNSCYCTRDLLMIHRSHPHSPKFVRQLHFTNWPDFGCPDDIETLVNFVKAFRQENVKLNGPVRPLTPILVHCSAGVGRTGTLIALDILMEQAQSRKVIDVVGTVLKIRRDRGGMVQTREQYYLLYKCVEYYVRTDLPASLSGSDGSAWTSILYQSSDSLSSGTTGSSSAFSSKGIFYLKR